MRGFTVIIVVMAFLGSLWVSGCSTSGGSGVAERLIQAQPAEIVEAIGYDLQGDGLRLISRSDRGDIYERQLSAAELGGHATLAEIARNGDMTLRARVSRSEIEIISSFPDTDTQVGFLINMTPAPDGQGTMARLEPVLRGSGAEQYPERVEELRRRFASQGENLLAGIASTVEG